jgi:hypothetical protein
MIEEDLWDCVLKPYETDPANAFILAQCFWLLRQTLTEGPDGVQQVIRLLENGIRDLYPYTDAYQASYTLYERLVTGEGLSREGDLPEKLPAKPKHRT